MADASIRDPHAFKQQTASDGTLLAGDGTPLKQKLRQALAVSRRRAFFLVAPLLLFIMASFVIPIILLLWQGVKDDTYASIMPESAPLLRAWDSTTEPSEEMAAAVIADMVCRAEK